MSQLSLESVFVFAALETKFSIVWIIHYIAQTVAMAKLYYIQNEICKKAI